MRFDYHFFFKYFSLAYHPESRFSKKIGLTAETFLKMATAFDFLKLLLSSLTNLEGAGARLGDSTP